MRKNGWRVALLGLGILFFCTATVILMRMERAGKILPQHEVSPTTTATKRESGFVVGAWQGRLAVFALGEPQPMRVYEVYIASLPPEEQARLKEGVAVPDHPTLAALIEDYTG